MAPGSEIVEIILGNGIGCAWNEIEVIEFSDFRQRDDGLSNVRI